jgi:predicted amidohydrolase
MTIMKHHSWKQCLSLLLVLLPTICVFGEDPLAFNPSSKTRHEKPPRKVIVGTTMTRWYSDYPGLDQRIEQIRQLVAEMSARSKQQFGRSHDLALFTEYAITAGKPGSAAQTAVSLQNDVLPACADIAREYKCYLVFGGIFNDHPTLAGCTNEAVIIGRGGELIGRYVKVHPVPDDHGKEGTVRLEGGVTPGIDFNVFDLDFGRVGLQICYDVEYPEGWRRLANQGVELVLYPTQSPQLTRTAMYAAMHEYWVVSSTFRNNASFFEPGTGLVAAQIREPHQTLVHELDLSFLILPWSSELQNGKAFRDKFGDRVGFRYSESEDRGVFWSNDPARTIGQMADSLGLLDQTSEQQARARRMQDKARGGEAQD